MELNLHSPHIPLRREEGQLYFFIIRSFDGTQSSLLAEATNKPQKFNLLSSVELFIFAPLFFELLLVFFHLRLRMSSFSRSSSQIALQPTEAQSHQVTRNSKPTVGIHKTKRTFVPLACKSGTPFLLMSQSLQWHLSVPVVRVYYTLVQTQNF